MTERLHILDERESLGRPFVLSAAFHAAVFLAFVLASLSIQRSHEAWGSANTLAGDAVAVTPTSIRLPPRHGVVNRVANDTESQVPQAPKVEPKKQVQAPDPAAIPMKSRVAEKQPKPQAQQRYQAAPPVPNQVYSTQAPAAVSPMFQKPGSGGVGVGPASVFGNRFGAYSDLVVQRVTEKWQTNGLTGMHTAPMVIITFDILRDGSVRNVQVAQRSGNSTLDYSAQRAVMDAAPFPPLPAGFDRNEANVDLRFQLQK